MAFFTWTGADIWEGGKEREKDGRSVISQSPFARSRSRMNETTYLKRGERREREKRIGTIESRSGREVV